MPNEFPPESDHEGLRVKLTRSLCYFDKQEQYQVFIPKGTDGRAMHVTKDGVTVLFSRALVGPAAVRPHEPTTIEEWTVDDVDPSFLEENV